jgi:carboxypeptidase PM20D1
MTFPEKLQKAIRIPTVSYSDPALNDREQFRVFQAFLEEAFPGIHRTCLREIFSDTAVLYTWKGSKAGLDPILLIGHYDVVPPGDESAWGRPPFGGDIAEGFVWGRGTLDDKQCVVSLLEAAESLIEEGFTPDRTVLFAFGGDEENGGFAGAAVIATALEQRGVRAEFLLDEGSAIVEGMIPGIKTPAALIGIAEKGFANIELRLETEAGHSAMPPDKTAAGRIARAAAHIEDHPFSPRIIPVVRLFFEALAPRASGLLRLLFAHPRVCAPLLKKAFLRSPSTAAMVRTTQAVTMLQGSMKENVLPSRARAVINVRLLPGDDVETVISRYRRLVRDPDMEVTAAGTASRPVGESPASGLGWDAIGSAVGAVYPEAVTVPYLVTAYTDSRHYRTVARALYRFIPMRLTPGDLSRIHGTNERISLKNLDACRRAYTHIMRYAAGRI